MTSKDVVDVELAGGTRLLLTFEGGEQRSIDLADFLRFEGVFAPLLDPNYFRQVRVNSDVGTIVWPNGADVCPDVLYERSVAVERPRSKAG